LTGEKTSANIPPMNILIKLDDETGRALEEMARRENRTKTAMARILLSRAIEEASK
jgi:predicted transcriptional regulator